MTSDERTGARPPSLPPTPEYAVFVGRSLLWAAVGTSGLALVVSLVTFSWAAIPVVVPPAFSIGLVLGLLGRATWS